MKRFDPSIFKLSENLSFETNSTPYAPVTVIHNFYEDLRGVVREINKLPGVSTAGAYEEYQGKHYWDLRKSYKPSMRGTDLPLFEQLPSILSPILGVDKEKCRVNEHLLVNAFMKKKSFPKGNFFFGAHTDSTIMSGSQIALVVFLNKKYDKDEGINFYSFLRREPGNNGPYTSIRETPICWFIQAEPNLAVLFDSAYVHGQAVGGKQFYRDWRQTQVIFVGIESNCVNSGGD